VQNAATAAKPEPVTHSVAKPIAKPAPVVKTEAKPVAKPAPVVKTEPKPVAKPARVAKAEPKPVAKPAPVVKPQPKPEVKPAPVVKPERTSATTSGTRGVRTFYAKAPDHAILVLEAPEDAIVYLAGQRMKASGPIRSYRIPLNNPDKEYRYPVRLQFEREGKVLAADHTQTLKAGNTVVLKVDETDLKRVTAVAKR